jgi:hypothetical protein
VTEIPSIHGDSSADDPADRPERLNAPHYAARATDCNFAGPRRRSALKPSPHRFGREADRGDRVEQFAVSDAEVIAPPAHLPVLRNVDAERRLRTRARVAPTLGAILRLRHDTPFPRAGRVLLAQRNERGGFDRKRHAQWGTIMARISMFTRGPDVRVCSTRDQGARRSASIASVAKRSAHRQHDLPTPRVRNFGWKPALATRAGNRG